MVGRPACWPHGAPPLPRRSPICQNLLMCVRKPLDPWMCGWRGDLKERLFETEKWTPRSLFAGAERRRSVNGLPIADTRTREGEVRSNTHTRITGDVLNLQLPPKRFSHGKSLLAPPLFLLPRDSFPYAAGEHPENPRRPSLYISFSTGSLLVAFSPSLSV